MTDYQIYRRNIEFLGLSLLVLLPAAYLYGMHVGKGDVVDLEQAVYRGLSPQCRADYDNSARVVADMRDAIGAATK